MPSTARDQQPTSAAPPRADGAVQAGVAPGIDAADVAQPMAVGEAAGVGGVDATQSAAAVDGAASDDGTAAVDGAAVDRADGVVADGAAGVDGADEGAGVDGVVAELRRAVARHVEVELDGVDDAFLHRLVGENERALRSLEAHRARLAAELSARAVRRARAAAPRDPRAGERAAREVRRSLVDDHRLTPSQAKQSVRSGKQLASSPVAARAARDGDLSASHLVQLQRVLAHLRGDPRGPEVEAELVAAARTQDPVEFGRTCRRRLAQLDEAAATRDLQKLHGRRSGRLAQGAGGMTHLGVDVAGADAEWLVTAVHAYRRPDASGEHRSTEQRTADAVVAMARAALGALKDPDARGARPLFLITLPDPDPDGTPARWKVGETLHAGPLPRSELERLLGDSHLAAVLADAQRAPTTVTRKVRTVPMGLWRTLLDRDRTCVWPGCDVLGEWCQVMHTDRAYAEGGRLSIDDAALGCAHHHRLVDQGAFRVVFRDGHPDVVHRDGRPLDSRPRDGPAP